MKRKVLAPPNSIIFVLDPTNRIAVIPDYRDSALVSATPSCISIATLAEMDGETEIILDTDNQEWDTLNIFYSDLLETPGQTVAIVTSGFDEIVATRVLTKSVTVDVMANNPYEPSKIVVLINKS